MTLYKKLVNKEEQLSLIGLGYFGMPIKVTIFSTVILARSNERKYEK